MRYLLIICLTLMLGACGNRLKSLEQTGQKVSKTVNACTKLSNSVCPQPGEATDYERKEEKKKIIDRSFFAIWDIHMLLR